MSTGGIAIVPRQIPACFNVVSRLFLDLSQHFLPTLYSLFKKVVYIYISKTIKKQLVCSRDVNICFSLHSYFCDTK